MTLTAQNHAKVFRTAASKLEGTLNFPDNPVAEGLRNLLVGLLSVIAEEYEAVAARKRGTDEGL